MGRFGMKARSAGRAGNPIGKAMGLGAGLLLIAGCQPMVLHGACLSCQSGASMAANQAAFECMGRIATNPAYRSVAAHQPLDGSDPTAAQLADPAVPTPEEARTLAAVHEDIVACRGPTLKNFSQIAPAVIPAALEAYRDSDRVTDELVNRKITWGEANKRKRAIRADLTAKAARIQAESAAVPTESR